MPLALRFGKQGAMCWALWTIRYGEFRTDLGPSPNREAPLLARTRGLAGGCWRGASGSGTNLQPSSIMQFRKKAFRKSIFLIGGLNMAALMPDCTKSRVCTCLAVLWRGSCGG